MSKEQKIATNQEKSLARLKGNTARRLSDREWAINQMISTIHYEDTTKESILEFLQEEIERLQELKSEVKNESFKY
jgi:hypothetical protein